MVQEQGKEMKNWYNSLPPSNPTDGKGAVNPPHLSKAIDEIEASAVRGAMLKAFMSGSGMDASAVHQGYSPNANVKIEEKVGYDVGAIWKANSDMVQGVITSLSGMALNRPDMAQDAHFLQLQKDVGELKHGLMQDPLDSLTNSAEKVEALKRLFGAGEGLTNDAVINVQIQQLKNEAQDRQNAFELQMTTIKRQFEVEDQRWQQEYALKKGTQEAEQARRESASHKFEDLFTALVSSIDINAPAAAPAGAEVRRSRRSPRPEQANENEEVQMPQSFTCDLCGTAIEVPEGTPIGALVECPNEECFGEDGQRTSYEFK